MNGPASDRLVFRQPRLEDAEALIGFLGDAGAMQFTVRLADVQACRGHIAAHACQAKTVGYGPWTIMTKSDGQIIGFGGLYDDPFDPGWGPEIAYHFAPSVWGRGYATELTQHCLQVGHFTIGLPVIKAFAHPENVASRKVSSNQASRKTGSCRQ